MDGVTPSWISTDYAEVHNPYQIKFGNDGDYVQIRTEEPMGEITIGVKMVGGPDNSKITIKSSVDGENYTDSEELEISGAQDDILTLKSTKILPTDARYVRLVYTKGSNVGIGPITIQKPLYTRTVTPGNYGTICLPYAVSYASGATFYVVTGKHVEDDELKSVIIEEVEGPLEAGVAYIFKANSDELTAYYTGAAVAEPVSGNALVGTFTETLAPQGENSYVLSGGKIYQVDSDVTLGANRAYFDVSQIPDGAEVRGEVLRSGDVTGVQTVKAEQAGVIYDLNGRIVQGELPNLPKGIYVVNGRKVVK